MFALFQEGVFNIVLFAFQFMEGDFGFQGVPLDDTGMAFMDMDLVMRESVRLTGEDDAAVCKVSCFCIICFFSCNVKLEDDFGMFCVLVLFSCRGLSPPMTVLTSLLLSVLT